ncbi:probable methylcrotonoyl-CoA carboxylase beta chain, mitochondrial [Anopheles merus]|uniref:probable methylcrotonoyl-CoA carboxylase beta chain, mitochondrial n=1 Tax=Anopheles merus TaxID=30066 RepID=UPI001BE3FD8A|nr:probable methylcrotonoyl-CoA carboxylase beta chain, mitochondrial [Anopheles merus]
MCGRAYSPLHLHVAEQSHLGDGRSQAAGVLANHRGAVPPAGREWTEEIGNRIKAPIVQQFEAEGSPYYSTARLWDDGIIDPVDTRRVLGLSLQAALNQPVGETRFGVFRM